MILNGIYRTFKDLKKNMNIMQKELEDIKKESNGIFRAVSMISKNRDLTGWALQKERSVNLQAQRCTPHKPKHSSMGQCQPHMHATEVPDEETEKEKGVRK